LDYEGKASLAYAFEVVEKFDKVICQHDATKVIFGIMEIPKPNKSGVVSSILANRDPKVHCWRRRGIRHT